MQKTRPVREDSPNEFLKFSTRALEKENPTLWNPRNRKGERVMEALHASLLSKAATNVSIKKTSTAELQKALVTANISDENKDKDENKNAQPIFCQKVEKKLQAFTFRNQKYSGYWKPIKEIEISLNKDAEISSKTPLNNLSDCHRCL